MFSHQLSSIPSQNYRVDSHPNIEQLNEMIAKAKSMSGVRHNYLWEVKKDFKKYTLSLHCKEDTDDDIDWWLHEENVVGTKLLWFHKTKDIAIIYPHILSGVGAKSPQEEEEEERRRKEMEKQTLGERLKRTPTADHSALGQQQEARAEAEKDLGQASVLRLMSGSLRMRPIAWLLQTAAQSELTGELTVKGSEETIVIQFGLGRAVHAVGPNKVGTEAILELFAWDDGASSFIEGTQPETASVQDSHEEIMRLGSRLLENAGFLAKNNINLQSKLSRPPIGLSEEQLEQRLKDGPDHGFKVQRSFYKQLDGTLTLMAAGEKVGLDRSRILAIAVNFLKLGLVLTPDGRSLRQVAQPTTAEFGFGGQQSQSGSFSGPKPPPGFFGSGSTGTNEMARPSGEVPKLPSDYQPKTTSEVSAPLQPPKFVFGGAGGGDADGSASGAYKTPRPTEQELPNTLTPGTKQENTGSFGKAPLLSAPFQVSQENTGSFGKAPVNQENTGSFGKAPVDQNTGSFGKGAEAAATSQETTGSFNKGLAGLGKPTAPNKEAPLPSSGRVADFRLPQHDREFFDVGAPRQLAKFDDTASDAVMYELCDKQSGIVTFDVFQFFLEREFARAFRFSSEFSLLVFCIKLGGNAAETKGALVPVLPMKSLQLTMQAINGIKRDVDILGHFGDKTFGMILPGVGAGQSVALVDRVVADLPKLAPKMGGHWPIFHFGIANVPHDARDINALVEAAQQAMLEAVEKKYTRIRFTDMTPD